MEKSRLSLMAMKDDGGKRKSKAERKAAKTVTTPVQYGIYSGIIDEKGKSVDRPTEEQSIKTMAEHMKNNNPNSTVYRSKTQHIGINYDRKKKQSNA